jgi:hypothetical protein
VVRLGSAKPATAVRTCSLTQTKNKNEMEIYEIVLWSLGAYLLISAIVYMFTRNVEKSLGWILHLFGAVLDGLSDADWPDIDFD